MISIKNNFLFIHIPKTGGNSIQQILMDYSEDFVVSRTTGQDGLDRFNVINEKYHTKKHSPLWFYKLMLPRKLFADLFKFAIIRNPWDRAISYYFSPHRGVKEWNRTQFITTLDEIRPATSYLCSTHPIINTVNNWLSGSFKPIDSEVNFLLRFENLEKDFKDLCDKINIPFHSLDHRNKSAHDHYSKYYDADLVTLVEKRYHEEIDWAGYQFERK
jgi:hypothetical protein